MTWKIVDPSTFTNGAVGLAQSVVDEKAGIAIARKVLSDLLSPN
jgi:hypothetical protein